MVDVMHTPEPWLVDKDENGIYIVESDGNRAIAKVLHGRKDADAVARRIVACVNACRGVKTENLEITGILHLACGNEWDTVTEQRDQLLSALESLILFTKPTKSNAAALANAHRVIQELKP